MSGGIVIRLIVISGCPLPYAGRQVPSQLTVAQQSVWLVTVLSETAEPITRAARDEIKIAFISLNVPGSGKLVGHIIAKLLPDGG